MSHASDAPINLLRKKPYHFACLRLDAKAVQSLRDKGRLMEIRVENVCKLWGQETLEPTLAIDSATHTFGSQKFTCLLGPSGCGKSTLLQIIGGISPLSLGRIQIVDPDTGREVPLGQESVMVWQ